MLRPYSMAGSATGIDRLYLSTGMHWPTWATAWFYARRSDRMASEVPRRTSLVIGDRSIVTSYVTRWDEKDPIASMDAVDRLERRIPLPDHIVLLDVPVVEALRRIEHRPRRRYGCRDECGDRLSAAADRYRLLARNPSSFGLGGVSWHVVNASRSLNCVAAEVTDLVYQLTSKDRYTFARKGARQ